MAKKKKKVKKRDLGALALATANKGTRIIKDKRTKRRRTRHEKKRMAINDQRD